MGVVCALRWRSVDTALQRLVMAKAAAWVLEVDLSLDLVVERNAWRAEPKPEAVDEFVFATDGNVLATRTASARRASARAGTPVHPICRDFSSCWATERLRAPALLAGGARSTVPCPRESALVTMSLSQPVGPTPFLCSNCCILAESASLDSSIRGAGDCCRCVDAGVETREGRRSLVAPRTVSALARPRFLSSNAQAHLQRDAARPSRLRGW